MVRRLAAPRPAGMHADVRRRLLVVFGILDVLLIAILASSFAVARSVNQSSEQKFVQEAIPLKSAVQDLVLQMVNEETGSRGYVITGNRAALQPLAAGRARVPDDLRTIAQLVLDRARARPGARPCPAPDPRTPSLLRPPDRARLVGAGRPARRRPAPPAPERRSSTRFGRPPARCSPSPIASWWTHGVRRTVATGRCSSCCSCPARPGSPSPSP